MGFEEFSLRLMVAVRPMLVSILAVVVITCACLPVLVYKCRGLWVNSPNFRYLSVFYKIRFYDAVRLASACIKLILALVFVVQFQKLQEIHYVCLAMVAVLYAIDLRSFFRTFSNVFWVAIQFVSVFSLNVICSYMLDITTSIEYVILYVVLGIFVVLFAIYLFITEINEVSMGRRAKIEVNIK